MGSKNLVPSRKTFDSCKNSDPFTKLANIFPQSNQTLIWDETASPTLILLISIQGTAIGLINNLLLAAKFEAAFLPQIFSSSWFGRSSSYYPISCYPIERNMELNQLHCPTSKTQAYQVHTIFPLRTSRLLEFLKLPTDFLSPPPNTQYFIYWINRLPLSSPLPP